jgi:hypothetical protein
MKNSPPLLLFATGHDLRSAMISSRKPILASLAIVLLICLLQSATAFAQLAPNQTNGFGNGRLVTFTYLQNFDCVDQPTLDLDFNHKKAQSDPNEMQTPICQVVTEPTADPTGGDIKHTAHLYVFVPMFSANNDQNPADAMECPNGGRPGELCGPALGAALIKAFGFVPEAWKTHPLVPTQCPDPNNPVPGTCTMHASSVDLSFTLAALGDREYLRAHAKSRSCRGQFTRQRGTNLVGSSTRPDTESE